MKNIIGFSFFSFLLVMTSFVPVEVQDYKVDIVVIDAGHGGKDPGTHGKKAKEKDIALSIALELGATIKTYLPDVKVIYTRDDDTFIPLDKRAEIANKNGADLFISVHCNASPSSWVRGTETWVMGLHKTADKHLLELLPENPDFEPIRVDLREQAFAIEGLSVGVLRRGT